MVFFVKLWERNKTNSFYLLKNDDVCSLPWRSFAFFTKKKVTYLSRKIGRVSIFKEESGNTKALTKKCRLDLKYFFKKIKIKPYYLLLFLTSLYKYVFEKNSKKIQFSVIFFLSGHPLYFHYFVYNNLWAKLNEKKKGGLSELFISQETQQILNIFSLLWQIRKVCCK